jgi:flagellar basal body-associated protein FliL
MFSVELVKERITIEGLNRQLKNELQEATQQLKDSIVQSTGQREKLALIEEKVPFVDAYYSLSNL